MPTLGVQDAPTKPDSLQHQVSALRVRLLNCHEVVGRIWGTPPMAGGSNSAQIEPGPGALDQLAVAMQMVAELEARLQDLSDRIGEL